MRNATIRFHPLYVIAHALNDPADRPGQWTSTSGQDATVQTLLGYGGRASQQAPYFVELGAHHPISGSNTRALERDYGWRGLCIEANPRLHGPLLAHRACTVIAAAVSDTEQSASLVEAGAATQVRKGGSAAYGQIETVQFSRILRQFEVPRNISYLSLDVEGHEEQVMRSFPFQTFRMRLLTVERPPESLRSKLRSEGYAHACNHGLYGDELWVDSVGDKAALQHARSTAVRCRSKGPPRCEPIGNPRFQCYQAAAKTPSRSWW